MEWFNLFYAFGLYIIELDVYFQSFLVFFLLHLEFSDFWLYLSCCEYFTNYF